MPKSTPQKSKRPLITFIVIAVVLLAGVTALVLSRNSSTSMKMNGPSSNSTASTTGAVNTNTVEISNYAYSPKVITVKAGTMVTWTNKDAVKHSVTSDNGTMLVSGLFGRDETFTYTFKEAGTFTYHCDPHPYMHGTVVVTQ